MCRSAAWARPITVDPHSHSLLKPLPMGRQALNHVAQSGYRVAIPRSIAYMLNLERLRTLDALARHGSVSGAAEGLHVTTSAVSQQMSKLEREVGQQLLAKNGRGVRLTDAGRLLAEHAARILSQVEFAQSDLEAHRGEVAGELRLAAFPTAARGLFPAALSRLRKAHPGLRVTSRETEPEPAVLAVM